MLPLGRLLLRIITRTLLFLLPRLGLRAVSVLSASLSRALVGAGFHTAPRFPTARPLSRVP